MASAKEMGLHDQAALHRPPAAPDSHGQESVKRPGASGHDPRAPTPLASVGDAFNAVFVEAEAARPADVLRPRRGRHPRPRAAVLGDIVAAAPETAFPVRGPRASPPTPTCRIRPIGESMTRYHISLDVADRQGVLATVAGVFAKHEVSIATVRQSGRGRPTRPW